MANSYSKSKNKAGVWIKQSTGYSAYIPNPLPPAIEYNESLQNLLAKANLALGRLDGIGKMLSNPYLLVRPIVRQEAVLSSRIEGTQTSLSDLYAYELEGEQLTFLPSNLQADAQEVNNYVKALEYGLERLSSLPLSLRLIKELHQILMQGVRGEHKSPGEFRQSQNWIGSPGSTLKTAAFVPPPPHELMNTLGEWENYIHANPQEPVLIQAGLLHSQFEAIHPFLDGNGRIGRLLITLFLIEREVLSLPLLNISAYFEAHRMAYYEALNNVTHKGDWGGWLKFFLDGVLSQAEETSITAKAVLALQTKLEKKLSKASSPGPLLKALDYLFTYPVTTPKHMAETMAVSFQTTLNHLAKLEELKIVKEVTGNKRNRRYHFSELLKRLQ